MSVSITRTETYTDPSPVMPSTKTTAPPECFSVLNTMTGQLSEHLLLAEELVSTRSGSIKVTDVVNRRSRIGKL